DYSKKVVQDYHGTLNEEYYQKAINKLTSLSPNPTFYIFSDDVEWVKDKLLLKRPAEFITGEVTKNHYEDFYLMSQCKHNIIANSSFSWWAAWLNPNPDKIVIAPKKWFNNAPYNTNDLIPQSWIKL
ncbi:MAG TPA: alpha-1,2-fucosyltransferase, partial [Segetibacter sp.]|nr:alpha-1,2-fucosyltransferase [Segetibacter sp.]